MTWRYGGPARPEGLLPAAGDEQRVADDLRVLDGHPLALSHKFVRLWRFVQRR
jgi:hypothetical protein